ncbi:Condensation domain-containing protein [Arthrobacter alpinus]|uniref:Condensation domain-containing protein n=1 Tax=Arthrobacter alpinus TaxID=656366 RepID=A0A1H5LNN3_9MICC|nr:condensation domain-containing protein [Arthrobacter alpinus]SEE78642.1 Condensation domain-containing protein [Arthrobacter alpinus]
MGIEVLTLGQSDLVRGTYGPDYSNRYVIAMAITAPGHLDRRRIEAAAQNMERSHPALRTSLTSLTSVFLSRQVVSDHVSGQSRAIHVSVFPDGDDIQDVMDRHVRAMAEQFDVVDGQTWGTVHIRGDNRDYVVFVFNHVLADLVSAAQFVRTFTRSYARERCSPSMKDTYVEFLSELESQWLRTPGADVNWWLQRPWAGISEMPQLQTVDDNQGSAAMQRIDRINGAVIASNFDEGLVISALAQAVQESTSLDLIRIDAAAHGRHDSLRRGAGGWVAHALPFILSNSNHAADVEATKAAADSWPASFQRVRNQPNLPLQQQISGHAFVNFFGSFNPANWKSDGFTASPVQPKYQPSGGTSLTPIRLKIQKQASDWVFAWSFSPRFGTPSLPNDIATQTIAALSIESAKAKRNRILVTAAK